VLRLLLLPGSTRLVDFGERAPVVPGLHFGLGLVVLDHLGVDNVRLESRCVVDLDDAGLELLLLRLHRRGDGQLLRAHDVGPIERIPNRGQPYRRRHSLVVGHPQQPLNQCLRRHR
jgi:hypothetical protein